MGSDIRTGTLIGIAACMGESQGPRLSVLQVLTVTSTGSLPRGVERSRFREKILGGNKSADLLTEAARCSEKVARDSLRGQFRVEELENEEARTNCS